MSAPKICFLTATELVRHVRAKKLSALEVMEAHLAQIERVNPEVNAIVTITAEQAMDRARAADDALARGEEVGLLCGLPVAHKDLFPTEGVRTTFGSLVCKDFVPDHNALIVERLKVAGAISVGKTNTPEFGAGSQTFNEIFGETLNPYDPATTCGGSSGGAAVALACGMVPIADGSDMGGSLRNPASFCNVVGFRPSPGRVPSWPDPTPWLSLTVDGPMARTVEDTALMLSAMAGLDPRVTAVLENQRCIFESLGCAVEDAQPDFVHADEIFKTLRAWRYELAYSELLEDHRDALKDTVVWNIEEGARLSGPQIGRAERKRTELFHRMRSFMHSYEFLVSPVCQVPPFDVQQRYVTEIDGERMETYINWMKSCYYVTVAGLPAASVPCGFTPEGLPVGAQIVGRYRDDFGVLQLAHAFEEATRHGERRPPLAG